MSFTENENITDLLVLIDVEKAFGSVLYLFCPFIYKTLEYFGFGINNIKLNKNLTKILRLLFYNVASCQNSSKSKEGVNRGTR